MGKVSVVGGGLGGLVAAIACAEQGAEVDLYEAHKQLGGRARTTDGEFRANLGAHVIYSDGFSWKWLSQRNLLPRYKRGPLSGTRFYFDGHSRRTPPLAVMRALLRVRGHKPDAEPSFREWASEL